MEDTPNVNSACGSRDRLAPCGIDCSNCDLFLATTDQSAAESLVNWFHHQGWLKPEEGAREIMSRGPYCAGCRGDQKVQWCGDCRIRQCCIQERKLHDCSACSQFACDDLNKWAEAASHHVAALERLQSMRGKRV